MFHIQRLFVAAIIFLVGCAGSPEKGEDNSPSKSNRDKPATSRDKTTPPDKKRESVEPPPSNFDYEAFLRKSGLAKGENKGAPPEKNPEKKAEHRKMLESIAKELKKKWKVNRGKAKELFEEAHKSYKNLQLKKAIEGLRQVLQVDPQHLKAKKLLYRIHFLQGKRAVLVQQAVQYLQDEKKVMAGFRYHIVDHYFQKGEIQFRRRDYDGAKKYFLEVLRIWNWANQKNILPEKLVPYQAKSHQYLQKISKRNGQS